MRAFRTYSLEWLDSLISVTLNPERPYLERLQTADIELLAEKLPLECLQVQSELTGKIFSINKEEQVRHIVHKYHLGLTALSSMSQGYESIAAFGTPPLKSLLQKIAGCLKELLDFIEDRYGAFLNNEPKQKVNDKQEGAITNNPKYKIHCMLSGDQIALILRGADEAQVFKARSMNAVFKAIIPYLSTEHKENLSADSIRSKAYNPEETDREAAVAALQAIIRKIQSY